MNNIVKVHIGDVVYYINEHVFNNIGENAASAIKLTMVANVAINTRTQEIIKCRYDLESLFDKVMYKM